MNNRARFWRLLGFTTVYGMTALAITVVFWRSPQPSADTIPVTTTSTSSVTTTAPTATSSAATGLDAALKVQKSFTANSAYGIKGSASFENAQTVVLHNFSIIGRGVTVHVELRDGSGSVVTMLKDISKVTYNNEDVVLAVPASADVTTVASIAIAAPDYQLVLSSAAWR